jgi:hypothetical protein
MFKGNQIPQADLSRPVCEEVLEEIQARLDAGWRVKGDIQLLINFACDVIQNRKVDEARRSFDRGVCKGVPCSENGCGQGNSCVS